MSKSVMANLVTHHQKTLRMWRYTLYNEASCGIANYKNIIDLIAIIDFNRNLLTHWGKTFQRAFLSWIVGIALRGNCITDAHIVLSRVVKEGG